MVKDIQKIIDNLLAFYDFKDKTIISVGAGGGQFVAYGYVAKKVIAIDNDKEALNRLKSALQKKNLLDKFTLIHSDFNQAKVTGDVVLFEFCLHEMKNPQQMIHHAHQLAKDIVVIDHGLQSQWAYIANENSKASQSWKEITQNTLLKQKTYKTEQLFDNYKQLYQKIQVQGPISIARISKFPKETPLSIPMEYTIVQIK